MRTPSLPSITVAAIQFKPSNNAQENRHKACELIREAATEGAQLVVLPELHLGPYFCSTHDVSNFKRSETIPGPSTDAFSNLAKQLGVVIVCSIFEARLPGLYHNTAVVLEQDGSIAGLYRKMHLPDDPGYHEKFYFSPGDQGFIPIQCSLGKLGVLICWDQWFPEAARLMALAGADILIYPTAIGWSNLETQEEHQAQLHAWRTIQQGHAVANHLPTLVCNRFGVEAISHNHHTHFWGNSFICDEYGQIIAHADDKKPAIIRAKIERSRTCKARQAWPFLRDRQVEHYQGLLQKGPSIAKSPITTTTDHTEHLP